MYNPDKAAQSLDELRRADRAINRRLEAQEDSYINQGMSEDEIQDRLAADRWNFQREWVEDRYPGEDVSPHIFNALSPNGAWDRVVESNKSPRLREAMSRHEAEKQAYENESCEEMEQSM